MFNQQSGDDLLTASLSSFGSSLKIKFGLKANSNSAFITSYERDDEMDLDFAQARYYNFNHGRFTSVDPLMASASTENPQTFNRYIYVGNNPLNITDPLGLSWYYSSSADSYKWFGDDETVDDGYVSVVGTEGNDERGVGSFVYRNGLTGGWVSLNAYSNSFQTFDTQEEALKNFAGQCANCQALADSIAENAETKGRTVRIVGYVAAAAGVCIGTAGAGCGSAVNVATAAIQDEKEDAENSASVENTNPFVGPITSPAIIVDKHGNAIPVESGQSITGSPNGEYMQVRDANGKATGDRIDGGGHATHKNPNARQPHGHRVDKNGNKIRVNGDHHLRIKQK